MSPRGGEVTPVGAWTASAPNAFDVERPLVVTCWNTHKGRNDGLADELEQLVDERESDLLLLQEFRPSIAVPMHVFGHHATSFRRGPLGPDEGVTTLATIEAEEVRGLRSPERELLVLTPKAALVSRYPTSDGRTLTCVNVHGLNFDPTGTQLARQLDALHRVVDPLDGPLVVGGDFNTWNERRLDAVRSLSDGLELDEIVPDVPGGKKGAIGNPRIEKLLSLDKRLHLDRLFVRGLAKIDAAWLDDYECSDHVPLCARLSFGER